MIFVKARCVDIDVANDPAPIASYRRVINRSQR